MVAAMLPAWIAPHAAHAQTARHPHPRTGAGATTCVGATLLPDGADAEILERATLCLVDRERAHYALRPLRWNDELGTVAAGQLHAMARGDYFADVRPSGQTPMSLVGATRYAAHAARFSVGQNIAWGSGPDATPTSIVAAWMASPPHRHLILTSEYRDAGVAVSSAVPSFLGIGPVAATYAIEFGARI